MKILTVKEILLTVNDISLILDKTIKSHLIKNGKEITKNISYILQFIDSEGLWQAH